VIEEYFEGIGKLLGDRRRREGFAMYACGLFGDGERKSVEPIATRACGSAEEMEATHAKLLFFVSRSGWEDRPLREYAARYALHEMQMRSPVRHWIIDDTGFLKQGKHSPGEQRQYTGSAGKVTNCQIAVSLTIATEHAHVPVDMQLYMPESWTDDRARCRSARVPEHVEYRPKWQIAVSMIESAIDGGLPRGVLLADADYGNKTEFRQRMVELGVQYALAVKKTTMVRRVHESGSRPRVGERMCLEDLAFTLDEKDVRKVTWREGTKCAMSAKFGIVRVEPMPGDDGPQQEQWLVIEWPDGEHLPAKYALATLPRDSSRKQIVRTLKGRWRTERAYEDLKGELGLDHFEGRSYPGWNHHVTVVLCCFAFRAAEQARAFSPDRARRDLGHEHDSLDHAA
jgi:SRSO17 transposase